MARADFGREQEEDDTLTWANHLTANPMVPFNSEESCLSKCWLASSFVTINVTRDDLTTCHIRVTSIIIKRNKSARIHATRIRHEAGLNMTAHDYTLHLFRFPKVLLGMGRKGLGGDSDGFRGIRYIWGGSIVQTYCCHEAWSTGFLVS